MIEWHIATGRVYVVIVHSSSSIMDVALMAKIALMALSKQYGIEHRVAVNSDARITPG